jgi:hypothetical protein
MAGVSCFCARGNERLVYMKGGEFDDLYEGRQRVKDSATHRCLIVLCVSEFVYKLLNCVASLQCCQLHNSCFSCQGSCEPVGPS